MPSVDARASFLASAHHPAAAARPSVYWAGDRPIRAVNPLDLATSGRCEDDTVALCCAIG